MKKYGNSGLRIVIFGAFIALYFSFTPKPLEAYVGLCCGKCGGNMPLNILGAGVPENHEFRFKVMGSGMNMLGLRQGRRDINEGTMRSLPTSIYQPSTSSMSGMGMGGMGGMQTTHGSTSTATTSDPVSVFKDNAYGTLTDRKYMATPQNMSMQMVGLAMAYSFTDNFFAGLMFMAHRKQMDMVFNYHMQSMAVQNGFTMKSEGMGDTMFITKYRLYADDGLIPRSQISLVSGMSLPTGSIKKRNNSHPIGQIEATLMNNNHTAMMSNMSSMNMSSSMEMHTMVSRREELLPYNMQLGSGTFDPILGVAYQGSSSPLWWGANLLYKGRFYKNRLDYALGDELSLDTYVMFQLLYNTVAQFQINAKTKGRIKGEADEAVSGASGRTTQFNRYSQYMSPAWDPANSGGDNVAVTLGIQWQPVPMNILEIDVQVPVYQRLNGVQMKEEYRVSVAYYIEVPTSASIRSIKRSDEESKIGF